MAMKKGGLGRGLEALFADNATDTQGGSVTLRLSEIEPNRDQPRKQFEPQALEELAQSIRAHGILQPLLVRPMTDGRYQLVAGERRYRAARLAGLEQVPVTIREMDDKETAAVALIENLQRQDLNPLEEAAGYDRLMRDYGLTQEETANVVHKSRPAVTNALRLLSLSQPVAELVKEGSLSAGHARALLSFPDEESQLRAANAVVAEGLSVRKVEQMAKSARTVPAPRQTSLFARNPFHQEAELALTEHLGRKVRVHAAGKGGTLQIEFYSNEDLKALAAILSESK